MHYVIWFGISMFLLAGTISKLAPVFGVSSASVERNETPVSTKPPPVRTGTKVTVPRGRDGQFFVDSVVAGKRVNFLVDSGASLIALAPQDVRRLGITPSARDQMVALQTANGTVIVPQVRLAAVVVGGLVVHDVDAVVMPPGTLWHSLLGMSFLSRLRRVDFQRAELVLEQ